LIEDLIDWKTFRIHEMRKKIENNNCFAKKAIEINPKNAALLIIYLTLSDSYF
jgi:hypothetical protein